MTGWWWRTLTSLALLLGSAGTVRAQPAQDPPGEEATEGADEAAEGNEAAEGGEAEPAGPQLTPPELVEAPPVTLPEDAEPLPPDASVELVLTIAPDGTVSEVRVFTPLREDVDALVLEAAQQMRFEPATRDGEPIPARVRFRYRITPPAPPPEEAEDAEGEGPAEGEDVEGELPEGPAADDLEGIDLSQFDTEVSELGIAAEVEPPEPSAAERITLQAEELTTVPGTFGEPLRVVATLPGVVRSPFGLGFFLVRGAAFQNTGFFVDGFPVPLLYHLGAGPAVISSRFVERLNFYPGGYPARYGRFSAGVIALETAPPPTDSIRGELSVDLFRASALVSVPFEDGRGAVAAAFRRSYYELLLPLVQEGIHLEYTDYQIRADYRPTSRLSLSLFVFGSDDVLDQTGSFGGGVASEGVQNRLGYDFQRVIAKIKIRLPENVRLTLAGMLGRDGNSFTNARPGTAGLDFALQNTYAAVRLDTEIPWSEALQTNLGFDINAIIFDVEANAFTPAGLGMYPQPVFSPSGSAAVDRSIPRALGAFYLEQIIRLETLEISAQGRFDYMRYGDVSEIIPDPRLVVRWQVVPELLIKAATGLFSQPPSAFQVVREAGNPGLPPQRAWQSSVGAEVMFPEQVEVRSTFFYSQMWDIARQTNRTVSTPDGPQRQFFVADREGRAYGLELMIRRRIEEGFYGWLSYTLSRSERRTDNGRWAPFTYDQTHVLNLAASYEIDGWRFGARFQLATGRPRSSVIPYGPDVTSVFDADDGDRNARFRSIGERFATFHRLDLRIDREFEIGPIEGSVYLDVQNVYNAANNEGTLYDYRYAETANLPGLPILPTIGVRGAIQ
ncbi:MAG TPA: TonB-dependent receptor [Sandaracinaceae bacterium LLY-WYZ-13_1]|nr:TonB-dependent receptor [Sandaracinaceae bacterium LLY-WYZ-13_1]